MNMQEAARLILGLRSAGWSEKEINDFILFTAEEQRQKILAKEVEKMPSEKEITIIQKAMLYDLIKIIKADPEKTYTPEELEKLFDAYMSGAEQ